MNPIVYAMLDHHVPCDAVGCGEFVRKPLWLCSKHSRYPVLSARRRTRLLLPGREKLRVKKGISFGEHRTSATYTVGRKKHRVGGPAVINMDAGVITSEEWFFEGRHHRSDGPAVVFYRADGSVESRLFYLHGSNVGGYRGLYDRMTEFRASRLTRELSITRYAELLDEDRDCTEILDALREGMTSVAGIRAVLEGTPVEWAKAFEDGETG